MLKKVMLSKEEAAALESALEVNGGEKGSLVHWHARDLWDGDRAPLNNLDLNTVCSALYVGYELEESPEEKVKEYYDNLLVPDNKMIVRATLTLLNINIKGINC
ncbi:hypothetical protein J1P26_17400 [Neobacillus sp. MM2021_6]|uniref:hypothetical protein n=1 Tax=Bacillaceae TaxID=186817 RepID=UPI0014089B7B|nr:MULTISPECIES: hypothetical protein [Bacillaceae]MBO0961485.1 hypothetical protein [Neobacillus sp. MM2021_6]NHC19589.1 hypothetical protein [Bacillus sp. MM2020_4]